MKYKIELTKEEIETIAAILYENKKRRDMYDIFASRVIDADMNQNG